MEIVNKEAIFNELKEKDEDVGDDDRQSVKYIDDIHRNQLEIIHLLREVDDRKRYIRQVKRNLYMACRHCFIRDSSAAFDDMYKWQCAKCHLYKGEFN